MPGEKDSSVPIAFLLKRGEVKVLIVEDDKFLRELLAGKFRREGYTVLEAGAGQEALAVIKEKSPHLILLDLLLTGSPDGYEVLRQIKAASEISSIPVIIISNQSSPEVIERALHLGAREYLVKAHHMPHEIVERVERVLEETYLRR